MLTLDRTSLILVTRKCIQVYPKHTSGIHAGKVPILELKLWRTWGVCPRPVSQVLNYPFSGFSSFSSFRSTLTSRREKRLTNA